MTTMPGASHIGGTKYLLMGLNIGEKTDANHNGEPGILGSQCRSVTTRWKCSHPDVTQRIVWRRQW